MSFVEHSGDQAYVGIDKKKKKYIQKVTVARSP